MSPLLVVPGHLVSRLQLSFQAMEPVLWGLGRQGVVLMFPQCTGSASTHLPTWRGVASQPSCCDKGCRNQIDGRILFSTLETGHSGAEPGKGSPSGSQMAACSLNPHMDPVLVTILLL